MDKLSNPQKTIEVLKKYQFNFQKKFGQNFLIDAHVLDKIIQAAEITREDFVLEIGPGIGSAFPMATAVPAARSMSRSLKLSPIAIVSSGAAPK